MSGPRPIGRAVPEVAGKALGKRGLAFGALLTDWATIVGPKLSEHTAPDRLSFPRGKREDATLHIRASGAVALELQHLEPLIVERINGFFGYRAVARIRLLHSAPLAPKHRPVRPRALSAEEESRLTSATERVEDPELRALLDRFGRAVIGRARG